MDIKKNRTPALPLPYMIDIKKAGGYYVWRDLAILENCKCPQAADMKSIKHRMKMNILNNLKNKL